MPSTINASNSGFGGIVSTGDSSGDLQLQTAGTTAVTINTSQNVGIGTNIPTFKLVAANSSTDGGWIYSSSVTSILGLGGYSGASDGAFSLRYDRSTGTITFNGGLRDTPVERMRIDSSGNLLVGTTSAINGTARLDISAPTGNNVALTLKNDAGAGQWTSQIWNSATSGNNAFMQFATEGTYTGRGSIDYNRAGNAVRYNTSSDQRLKENIVDSSSAIPLLESIKIRSFDWKETGFHVDYGVIAQELNEVVPDAVSIGDDNQDGMVKRSWGVDTSVLVPAMIKAIQEQQTIINDLKARIETLEAK